MAGARVGPNLRLGIGGQHSHPYTEQLWRAAGPAIRAAMGHNEPMPKIDERLESVYR